MKRAFLTISCVWLSVTGISHASTTAIDASSHQKFCAAHLLQNNHKNTTFCIENQQKTGTSLTLSTDWFASSPNNKTKGWQLGVPDNYIWHDTPPVPSLHDMTENADRQSFAVDVSYTFNQANNGEGISIVAHIKTYQDTDKMDMSEESWLDIGNNLRYRRDITLTLVIPYSL
ncbi:hypothetical protein CI610_02171 [invertebrate metagenome]|uniref:Uncharacterized protein n=1 Tax=invertebrate metagenome TaxID=1711999 RepID=A0A2H9T6M3_9ZZZZ